MKLKTTKSAIKNGFNTVISIGYCSAQYLLYYKNPFAYSSGVYGWACDYYEIGNKCISTGYSPIGEYIDYLKLRELEEKAGKIVNDYSIECEDRKQKVELLLNELLNNI